jgi:hypothetical protein
MCPGIISIEIASIGELSKAFKRVEYTQTPPTLNAVAKLSSTPLTKDPPVLWPH